MRSSHGNAGYAVSTSGGQPHSSTENDGYLVYKQGGRPNTVKSDYEASGKPTGETSRCCVGKSGGRPTGTTKMNGYGIGLSGGVYGGTQSYYLKMMWNSQMNGILALKLSTLTIVA